ncbi:metabotropic glutamate receptor, partial [Hyalella azteca]|uniref:Metabotropic glutamate receptor n=1 Tax=Hyalella azteca TaxID=294128 RepID=A0A979FPU0_HYAAZ
NEAVVEGTLSVQPQANAVRNFKEYFTNLTVETNTRNPWFYEYWEDHFKCKYINKPYTILGRPLQMQKEVEGESCCWHCLKCTDYQIVVDDRCDTCPQFQLPSADQTQCVHIPEVYITLSSWNAILPMLFASAGVVATTLVYITLSSWNAILPMLFASAGVVATALVAWVFVSHNNTPVVKASGRELSYVLLSGVFLAYCMTFVFVLKPTAVVCGAQRLGLGLCFTMIYSAILTKTNRIARIFNSCKKTTKRPSFISPTSQLCICAAMVVCQIFIITIWSLLNYPAAVHFGVSRDENFLVCSGSVNVSYLIAFAFPMSIILICTIYAWKTRKIPESFNESKYIGFTMYTTCVLWIAFLPIYYSTSNDNLRFSDLASSFSE